MVENPDVYVHFSDLCDIRDCVVRIVCVNELIVKSTDNGVIMEKRCYIDTVTLGLYHTSKLFPLYISGGECCTSPTLTVMRTLQ